ncbi:MAG: hypothetical protein QOF66_6036 [Mycobacterium sp.]|jgi:hypothetical protein|uniref:hypothetical protein n=1 Tax=Mycobacterium sp. TaxID=1785 RepID=UPI0028B5DDB9|nr:hypothetical protein [Mycobacterium sp.]
MGRWADTVHALTALTLAVGDRAGLTDSAVAGLWATAGYHDLTRARATPPPDRRRRDRLAVLVLTHRPGGGFLRSRINKNRRV